MSAQTIFFLALVLACPLMMMFMMRGMRGSDDAAPTDRYGG